MTFIILTEGIRGRRPRLSALRLPKTPFPLHIKPPARQSRRHLRAVISCLPKLCQEGWSCPFFVHALVVKLNKVFQNLQPALIHHCAGLCALQVFFREWKMLKCTLVLKSSPLIYILWKLFPLSTLPPTVL